MAKDKLFTQRRSRVTDFQFDESVANVFSDMIQRSVPGYEAMTSLIGCIAGQYAKPQTRIYDLGCSLGSTTLAMYSKVALDNVDYICVDNSQDMLDKCQSNLKKAMPDSAYTTVEANVEDVALASASVVVMNFTLQFVRPELRALLINRIYDALIPGGVLVLSEKVVFTDLVENEFHQQHHSQFKKFNGYSELEISQKRSALENVMILDRSEVHVKRLVDAGFDSVHQWYQAFNFKSLLAQK